MSTPAHNEAESFTFIDRPKMSLRVVSLAVWAVACFLGYKAVVEPPQQPLILWLLAGFFVLCSVLVLREFLVRPVRITTVSPLRREIVIEEISPLRKRRTATSIPFTAAFEIYKCEADNDTAYGVRINTKEKPRLIIAEYLSKRKAEEMAGDANLRLRGW